MSRAQGGLADVFCLRNPTWQHRSPDAARRDARCLRATACRAESGGFAVLRRLPSYRRDIQQESSPNEGILSCSQGGRKSSFIAPANGCLAFGGLRWMPGFPGNGSGSGLRKPAIAG